MRRGWRKSGKLCWQRRESPGGHAAATGYVVLINDWDRSDPCISSWADPNLLADLRNRYSALQFVLEHIKGQNFRVDADVRREFTQA